MGVGKGIISGYGVPILIGPYLFSPDTVCYY
jgi:hypothetical protein